MSDPDIRWQQRLQNFQKALRQLSKAVELSGQRPLSDLAPGMQCRLALAHATRHQNHDIQ